MDSLDDKASKASMFIESQATEHKRQRCSQELPEVRLILKTKMIMKMMVTGSNSETM